MYKHYYRLSVVGSNIQQIYVWRNTDTILTENQINKQTTTQTNKQTKYTNPVSGTNQYWEMNVGQAIIEACLGLEL